MGKKIIVIFLLCINLISCGNLKVKNIYNNQPNVGIVLCQGDNLKIEEKEGVTYSILSLDLNGEEKENLNKVKELNRNSDFIILFGEKLNPYTNKIASYEVNKNIVAINQSCNFSNVLQINYKDNEIGFLLGIIGANETINKKIGIIAPNKKEDSEEFIAGFISGINKSKENVNRFIKYVDSSDQEDINKQINDLYKKKCDVILTLLQDNNELVCKSTNEKGIKLLTDEFIDKDNEYNNIIASVNRKDNKIIDNIVEGYITGNLKVGSKSAEEYGIHNGYLEIEEKYLGKLDEEVNKKVEKYKKEILNKEIEIPRNIISAIEYK